MLNVQTVGVVVRLFAVWLATWALRNLPSFWIFNVPGTTPEMRSYALVVSILMLLIAITLWFFPLTVASKLISGKATAEYPTFSLEQIQSAGASLLGLWVLSSAVPNLGFYAVAIFVTGATVESGTYASIARLVIEVVIGLWLLFGARGIFGLVHWARGR